MSAKDDRKSAALMGHGCPRNVDSESVGIANEARQETLRNYSRVRSRPFFDLGSTACVLGSRAPRIGADPDFNRLASRNATP